VFALLAGSIALIGFGIDSLIEMSSGLVLLWRLQTRRDMESAERAEAIALRLVGLSFVVLAVYIAFESISALAERELPGASLGGIVIAVVSLIVMPILARAKRRVAAALDSRALHADSIQTDICMILSRVRGCTHCAASDVKSCRKWRGSDDGSRTSIRCPS
jgi:divalent metal cation (Fe/Co/Zn/Cd) transporter